tara:strand:+ start:4205 stop:6100 length:1896 start_codon:yes stop_codon:yes gene_type:complete
MNIIYKPWGKEVWLELNDKYCYKRIYINAGFKTSYQYHEKKLETNYIAEGKAEVWLENEDGVVEKFIANKGDFFTVVPPRKHRVIAITDTVLQEVSTPEVDDVIRLEDDTNRDSGRLESEHIKPGVLILAAGKGERLKQLTQETNKALLPINNQAIISKIINKFPNDYKFVITLSYKGSLVEEYLNINFENYDFEFVYVDDIDSNNSGPGLSALSAEKFLQRPFYLITADCLLTSPLPALNTNWLGVHPTSYPEKYSTVQFDKENTITNFINKSQEGFQNAFIGIAGITDYEVFWSELNLNIKNGELVPAFFNPEKYNNFKAITLDWFDTGNFDDLEKAKLFFEDKPLSLTKNNNEITYKENNKFIKFIPDKERLNNLVNRSDYIKFLPDNVHHTGNFLIYDWVHGSTLYELNELELFKDFINLYFSNIELVNPNKKDLKKFYEDKTKERINKFIEIYGQNYYDGSFTINDIEYPSLRSTIDSFDFDTLLENKFTSNFHGDLQFDNVLYGSGKFYYIDWRDSFGSSIDSGDVYYDLAKLNGGILMPYNLMKFEKNIVFNENNNHINFSYKNIEGMDKILNYFKEKLSENNFDYKLVIKLSALIYINMAPLHDEKFGKVLWFKGLEQLNKND